MASGKKRTSTIEHSAEGVELSRDVLSTLAHELGGIASALDLRATAMARSISENDLEALRDIAEQIRLATRAARFARGSDAFGMLNPDRRQSLAEWWRLTGRFTAAVLPRGISVEPQFTDAFVTATQASALTWIWLAGCKEVAERGLPAPARLVLKGGPAADGTAAVQLSAELEQNATSQKEPAKSRWTKYCARMAKELGVEPPSWERTNGVLRWTVLLPM